MKNVIVAAFAALGIILWHHGPADAGKCSTVILR